jgi:triosephosphate isomerase (TIM)
MNLSEEEGRQFIRGIKTRLTSSGSIVGIAPTALAISACLAESLGSDLHIGAQNCHWEKSGAFTGELSPYSLKTMGVSFAIVGHSERRSLFFENPADVAKRALGALSAGITPVFCVGETLEERQAGDTFSVLKSQLLPLLEQSSPRLLENVIVAYEPVWAIGTGLVASTAQIEDTHSELAIWLMKEKGWDPRILYGGSVKPDNYADIICLPSVHGALVGGASLLVESFSELISISDGFLVGNQSSINFCTQDKN